MIPRLSRLLPLALLFASACTEKLVGPAPMEPRREASKMRMDCNSAAGEDCDKGPYDLNNYDADYNDEATRQTFSTVEQVHASPIRVTGADFGTVNESNGRVSPTEYVGQFDCLKAVLRSENSPEIRMIARQYGCPTGPCISAYNSAQQAYLHQNLFAISSWVVNLAAWVTPVGKVTKTVVIWTRVGAGTGAVFTNIENYDAFNRRKAELNGCITNNADFYYEAQRADMWGHFPTPRYGW